MRCIMRQQRLGRVALVPAVAALTGLTTLTIPATAVDECRGVVRQRARRGSAPVDRCPIEATAVRRYPFLMCCEPVTGEMCPTIQCPPGWIAMSTPQPAPSPKLPLATVKGPPVCHEHGTGENPNCGTHSRIRRRIGVGCPVNVVSHVAPLSPRWGWSITA